MLQAYLSLGAGIAFGETVRDPDFADTLEIGIVVPLSQVEAPARRLFWTESYVRSQSARARTPFRRRLNTGGEGKTKGFR